MYKKAHAKIRESPEHKPSGKKLPANYKQRRYVSIFFYFSIS